MKYIKSNDYTYDEMWNDTQDILDRYNCDLNDIESLDTVGVAKFHSKLYNFDAEYIIDYRDNSHACCITEIRRRLWDADMNDISRLLKNISDDISDAMEFIERD